MSIYTTTADRAAARVSVVHARRWGQPRRRIAPGVGAVLGIGAVAVLALAAGRGDVARACEPIAPSMVSAEQWHGMLTSGDWTGDPRDGAEQLVPAGCLTLP
jgi:hypothetical protein